MEEVGSSVEKEKMKTGKIHFQTSGEREGWIRKKSRIWKKSSSKKVESEFSRADELIGV